MNYLLGAILFSLNSRKSKQTKNFFELWYKINFKNQQIKNILYLKSKLNQISLIALTDWQLLRQVSKKRNSVSNYIFIFGKLFHISHID